jgi:hypothetical protein
MTTNETQQPDALTRLELLTAHDNIGTDVAVRMSSLISEARREMDALRKDRDDWKGVAESVGNAASNALRMGQQQGRVELAQELLDADDNAAVHSLPSWAADELARIAATDANQ